MLILNYHIFIFLSSLILQLSQERGIFIVSFAIFSACIEICIWAWREKKVFGYVNWCHPVPVFVLGYCIVFYQLPFCYFAGYKLPYYSLIAIFAPENISYCVLLAVSGISSFFIGEHLYFMKNRKKTILINNKHVKVHLASYFTRIKMITNIILILFIVTFILFLITTGSLNNYFGFPYSHNTLYSASSSSYSFLLYQVFLYLLILLQLARIVLIKPNSMRSYLCAWDKIVLCVIILTITPFIMSGDRGQYLITILLIITPYFIFVKPLKFKHAAIVVISMAFVMGAAGEVRKDSSYSFKESISFKDSIKRQVKTISSPAKWPTFELASSFRTFNISTFYFPHIYQYNFGKNILYQVLSIIPFLSRISGLQEINYKNNYIYSSNMFFTNILTHGSFSSGVGTSSLADIYMDFGPYGIPIILLFWGIFLSWVSQKAILEGSSIFIFLYGYYSYNGIYVNRSTFLIDWKILTWVFILYFIIQDIYLFRHSRSR